MGEQYGRATVTKPATWQGLVITKPSPKQHGMFATRALRPEAHREARREAGVCGQGGGRPSRLTCLRERLLDLCGRQAARAVGVKGVEAGRSAGQELVQPGEAGQVQSALALHVKRPEVCEQHRAQPMRWSTIKKLNPTTHDIMILYLIGLGMRHCNSNAWYTVFFHFGTINFLVLSGNTGAVAGIYSVPF